MSMWLGWEGSCVCSEEGGRGHVHVVRRVGGGHVHADEK